MDAAAHLLTLARRVRTTMGGERAWRAIRPIYWKAVSAAVGATGVSMRFPDGDFYRIDPQFFAWQLDQYEPDVVRALTQTLTEESVVFDVGAHVGFMTLMAARRVTCGSVYAFEPSPGNFEMLERHVRINGCSSRVVASNVLVGDHVTSSVPFVHRRGQFTANSLAYAIEGGDTTATAMVTIDHLVARGEARPPTVVKIDVEGFEAAVLRGASDTLRRFRPLVICAMHPEPLALLGESAAAVVRFMADHGYSASDLRGRAATDPGFEEIVFAPVAACAS